MKGLRQYTIGLVAAVALILGAASQSWAACGNGVLDFDPVKGTMEQCDDGTATCSVGGLRPGQDCSSPADCPGGTCQELGNTPGCGAGPACNRDDLGNHCRSDCTLPTCGDGISDSAFGEECDDGNDSNTDGCLTTCETASCGDGFACSENNPLSSCNNVPLGGTLAGKELCDDGNNKAGDGCSAACVPEVCGDGVVQAGEECDEGVGLCVGGILDGQLCGSAADCLSGAGNFCTGGGDNRDDVTDACRSDCTLPVCGDTVLDFGEDCDDGNDSDADGCLTTCVVASCGDGFICSQNNPDFPCPAGKERCDDGNLKTGDGCDSTCNPELCGNGLVEGSDQCDLGFAACGPLALNAGALCQSNDQCIGDGCDECYLDILAFSGTPACGIPGLCEGTFGVLCGGDRGSFNPAGAPPFFGTNPLLTQANSDDLANGCRSNCVLPTCGDGVSDASNGEQCDDGNTSDTDGCTNNCTLARCGDGFICSENNDDSLCNNTGIGGSLTGKERCDDGNLKVGDGCDNTCNPELCGNGLIDGSDQCDLGFAACGPLALNAGQLCQSNDDCNGDDCDACYLDILAFLGTPACGIPGLCEGTFGVLCGGDRGLFNPAAAPPFFGTNPLQTQANSDSDADVCRSNCVFPTCGDGISDDGEFCDDGNASNNDTCLSNCRVNTCGDGNACNTINLKESPFAPPPPNCNILCAGTGGAGCFEFCDDGNDINDDGCSNTCNPNSCGNGTLESGEECDTGQATCIVLGTIPVSQQGQPCSTDADCLGAPIAAGDCNPAANRDDLEDHCRTDCTLPSCGDGVSDASEICDGGLAPSGVSCTGTCQENVCGDGIQGLSETTVNGVTAIRQEQCDDGDATPGDGCSTECTVEACGDGVTDISFDPAEHEECDAGIPLQHPDQNGGPTPVTNQGSCTNVCCWFGGVLPVGQPSSPAVPTGTFRDIDGAFDSLLGCHTPKLIDRSSCSTSLRRQAIRIEKLVSQGRIGYNNNNFQKAIRRLRRAKRIMDRIDRTLTRAKVDASCGSITFQLSDQKNRIASLTHDVQNLMPLF